MITPRAQILALLREAKAIKQEATFCEPPDDVERLVEAKKLDLAACSLFLEHAEELLKEDK